MTGVTEVIARAERLRLVACSDGRLSVSVPIQIRRRCGRKRIALPGEVMEAELDARGDPRAQVSGRTARKREVSPWSTPPTPLQVALARGHRWQRALESAEVGSLKELAAREGVDRSYVSRMVNLTTLAPDIVQAILDDTLPGHVTLFDLAVDTPGSWEEQRQRIFGRLD